MKSIVLIVISIFISLFNINKGNDQEHVYWVNSFRVPCEGEGSAHCLQIQQGEDINHDNWVNLYSSIEGFDYVPGYIYKILVKQEALSSENIPADTSSIKYTFIRLLKKEVDKRLRINDIWVLESILLEPIEVVTQDGSQKRPQIEIHVSKMKFYGNDGCNNIFGSVETLGETELILGEIAGTMMICREMEISNRFLKVLNLVRTYEIKDLYLLLFDESGKELLRFKKID